MNTSEVLVFVREKQRLFESNLVGTDMSLAELNTAAYILERGMLGEAAEALEELVEEGAESDKFRDEIADLFIFFGSLLNHIGMTDDELERRVVRKVMVNFLKYHPRNMEGKTIEEGMLYSRSLWNKD